VIYGPICCLLPIGRFSIRPYGIGGTGAMLTGAAQVVAGVAAGFGIGIAAALLGGQGASC